MILRRLLWIVALAALPALTGAASDDSSPDKAKVPAASR